VACHSLEPDVKVVGPSLAGVASRAATRKPGYAPDLYLYESITNPNAYLVPGFQPDLMPKTFADTLSPQDLADIIAFLMTQE
jgi:cytochrome c2